jgi:hypothetical protein
VQKRIVPEHNCYKYQRFSLSRGVGCTERASGPGGVEAAEAQAVSQNALAEKEAEVAASQARIAVLEAGTGAELVALREQMAQAEASAAEAPTVTARTVKEAYVSDRCSCSNFYSAKRKLEQSPFDSPCDTSGAGRLQRRASCSRRAAGISARWMRMLIKTTATIMIFCAVVVAADGDV